MITRGFIGKIRVYFDELGINAKNGISYDNFEKESIKTLNHCKDLSDARMTINLYRYCVKKWNKIKKIFLKKLSLWQEYNFEGASNIEILSDEDSQGVYYITNALNKNYREIFISSTSFEDEVYSFDYKNGKYTLGDEDDYYLKYSKTDFGMMKLFDKKDNLLCNIVLSDTLDVFLEKNQTKYELVVQKEEDENTFIAIFEKHYIDSLGDKDYIEFKNMVADIEWDLLNSKNDLGISKLTMYKEVDDISPFLYFAASTFLLYKSFTDTEKARERRSTMLSLMMIHNLNIRNLRKQ